MQLTNSILHSPACFLTNPSRNPSLPASIHCSTSSNRTINRTLASRTSNQLTAQEQDPGSFDVASTVVETAFRVKIDSIDTDGSDKARTTLRILFVSESGVCRGPLAAAAFAAAAQERGLSLSSTSSSTTAADFECSAAASRDYNVNDPPEPSAYLAAECLGWTLPEKYTARCFRPSSDLARQDLILVMDKFIAADVLREASVYDTIYLDAGFSGKVRNLGEFHPSANLSPNNNSVQQSTTEENNNGGGGKIPESKVFEIDDPLYGNIGGEEEEDDVYKAALDIQKCCNGLVDFLLGLNSSEDENMNMRAAVGKWLQYAEGVEWMKPPLLSPR